MWGTGGYWGDPNLIAGGSKMSERQNADLFKQNPFSSHLYSIPFSLQNRNRVNKIKESKVYGTSQFRSLNMNKDQFYTKYMLTRRYRCRKWTLFYNYPGWQPWSNMKIMLWHGMIMVIYSHNGVIMARSRHGHHLI